MSVLLDTNVISELVRPRPEPRVLSFLAPLADPLISVITLHEIIFGAERARDPARRAALVNWASAIRIEFRDRIVHIDEAVAEQSGRIRATAAANGAQVSPLDALIAACAASRGAAIATRNVKDFAALGVKVIDPWA